MKPSDDEEMMAVAKNLVKAILDRAVDAEIKLRDAETKLRKLVPLLNEAGRNLHTNPQAAETIIVKALDLVTSEGNQ